MSNLVTYLLRMSDETVSALYSSSPYMHTAAVVSGKRRLTVHTSPVLSVCHAKISIPILIDSQHHLQNSIVWSNVNIHVLNLHCRLSLLFPLFTLLHEVHCMIECYSYYASRLFVRFHVDIVVAVLGFVALLGVLAWIFRFTPSSPNATIVIDYVWTNIVECLYS